MKKRNFRGQIKKIQDRHFIHIPGIEEHCSIRTYTVHEVFQRISIQNLMHEFINREFSQAAREYQYLLDRDYPRKTILKIVGDRHMLNKSQRILLSRGIFKTSAVEWRTKRKKRDIGHDVLHIDTYNVLFTVSNYLLGRLTFVSNDYFIRDAGEIYGKLHRKKVFQRSLDLLMELIGRFHAKEFFFYLDRPVSYSDELSVKINEKLHHGNIKGTACTVTDPDEELIRLSSGTIATSDSVVMDVSGCTLFDLARAVLDANFNIDLPDLTSVLS